MHELMFQAGVKGMSERSELIPCILYIASTCTQMIITAHAIKLMHAARGVCAPQSSSNYCTCVKKLLFYQNEHTNIYDILLRNLQCHGIF